ncbi:MAG: TonB-dependent receptor [Acidobacteriota bacterium]
MRKRLPHIRSLALIPFWLMSLHAGATVFTGNIRGSVKTSDGSAIAGARLTVFTLEADRTVTTSAPGHFFFAGLRPGHYTVEAEADGYETVIRNEVDIDLSRTTVLRFVLDAVPDQNVTLEEETRLLDPFAATAGRTFTASSLRLLPRLDSIRALLNEVPGVLAGGTWRGGAFSTVGSAPGRMRINGAELPSDSLLGARSLAFDLENLDEVRVLTTSTAPELSSAAPAMFVSTPRGQSEFAGSLYAYSVIWSKKRQSPRDTGVLHLTENEFDSQIEGGLEAGGPVIADRLWVWGSVARESTSFRSVPAVVPELSSALAGENLQNERFRLDWRGSEQLSGAAWWEHGTGSTDPRLATVSDQTSDVRAAEVQVLLSPWSLVRVSGSHDRSLGEGLQFVPVSLRSRGSAVRADASLFFGGSLAQELSFGLESTQRHWSASAPPISSFLATPFQSTSRNGGLFLMDTILLRNITLEIGGSVQEEEVGIEGSARALSATDFLPRVAVAWSPGAGRSKDVLRLRLGRYVEPLNRCFAGEGIFTCGLEATPIEALPARLRTPATDEAQMSWEHEISPQFTVGSTYTRRRFTRELGRRQDLVGLSPLDNLDGERQADLAELHVEKRLSFGVMIHGFAAYEDGGAVSPSAQMPPLTGGSRWSWQLAGLVQVPLVKIDIATIFSGSQGAVIADSSRGRLDDRFQIDLRVGKHLEIRQLNLTLLLDVFNVTNESNVIGQRPGFGFLFSDLAPSTTFRVGAQLRF